jgi:ATP-binding cassette subfamily C protein
MKSYRLLLSDIHREVGWRLYVLIPLMAFVGVTEGLSVTLLFPLLTRIGIAGGDNLGLALQSLEAMLNSVGATTVGSVLIWIVLISAVQMCLFLTQNWLTVRLGRVYAANWQNRLFTSYLEANWSFHTQHRAGELINSITVETLRLIGAFLTLAQLLGAMIVASIYVIIAVAISWQASLTLIMLAALMFLSISRLYRTSMAAGRSLGPLNAELQVRVSEHLAAYKIIKATTNEERAAARVDEVVRGLQKAGATVNFLPSLVRGVLEFMGITSLATVLAFGSGVLAIEPAQLLVIIALFARLFPRLTALQTQFHNLNTNVWAILGVRTLHDAAKRQREELDDTRPGLDLQLPTTLEVKNLRASFSGNTVLNGIDVTLPMPGMIGIVGGSGAGKSTLVHALLGFVESWEGSVLLGNNDLRTVSLRHWRRAIGYVPQETILFHATIRDNIALARPHASVEEIERAARRAHAHDFIMELPLGYETPIGDQGVLLSGGQRQRLGIARALLSNPVLLLLDEPTSALDSESEREVLATFEELRKSLGILIVAHRLATVRAADTIYVFERGDVLESGSWEELMARRKRLHALAQTQHLVA